MDIVVCVKRVPMTQEVDLEIDDSGKSIKKDTLAFIENDWDNYAIEEAVLLQEKLGGTVTAITIGKEDDEEVLRRALAMGADRAIRVDPGDMELDCFVISKILSAVINKLEYDLVLTGVQSDDYNSGMVGIFTAEHLGLNHSAVVTFINPKENELMIRVELEDGLEEVSRIQLPTLLTIQTGINEPRYVSIMGIRKARKKELTVMQATELNISEEDLKPRTIIEEVYLPPETGGAEIIEGDASTVAENIIRILSEKGVSV